jgi:anti-sigma factor RsiW
MSNTDQTPRFNNGRPDRLSDEQLMAYLEGKLDPEAERQVEEWLSEEGAEADAIEGLKAMPATETKKSVQELNRQLHQNILRGTPKRQRHFKEDFWGWIAVIVVILLVVLGYIVVRIAQ